MIDAFNNRGGIYLELKEYDKAIYDFNAVIKIDPDFAAAYGNRGIAYKELNQKKKAIQDFQKALSLTNDEAIIIEVESELKSIKN